MKAEQLISRKFRLERADGSIVSNCLSFKPSGRIVGGRSRNESRWEIKRGRLHIIGAEGQTTTYFHSEHLGDRRYVLTGKYRGMEDPNWHVLREVTSSLQTEAYHAVAAKAEADGHGEGSYFNFLLRILKPRDLDSAWRPVRLMELEDIAPRGPTWRRLTPTFRARAETPAIFEFDDAEILPNAGFVVGEFAIEEFLFCTQPNWREVGLARTVADRSPIAYFDVSSERVYVEHGDAGRLLSGPHFWFGAPFAAINFGHFIHDLASQLIHVDRAKLIYGPRLKFVLPSFYELGFRHRTQAFLFEELFGPLGEVVFTVDERLRVETLCAGNPIFWPKRGQLDEASREGLRYLSRRIRERYARFARTTTRRRLYVTRDDGRNLRQLENEPEARALLIQRGFEPVTISNLDPLSVIESFYNAEAVAGAHGAGLLNVVLCDPDKVKLLELDVFPSAWGSIRAFAHGMGIDYAKVPARPGDVPGFRGATDIEALRTELDRLTT